MENNQLFVNMQLATVLKDRTEKYVRILEAINETIILCGHQNIALRGNRDEVKYDQESEINTGNISIHFFNVVWMVELHPLVITWRMFPECHLHIKNNSKRNYFNQRRVDLKKNRQTSQRCWWILFQYFQTKYATSATRSKSL